jgi:hypothetical protein
MFSSSLFFPGGCIAREHEKRWPSPGSRCDIPEASGHPRILLPLCVLPNPPASGLASSYSGVARNDSYRTVSSQPVSMEPHPPSLAEATPSRPLLSPYYRVACICTHHQGSNCRADPSQAQLVEGAAHPRAGTRERDMERGSGDRKGKETGVRWSAD